MKKCKACKEPFTPWNTAQPACSPSCALELVKAKKDKAYKKKTVEMRKEFRAKDRSYQLKKAQEAFNAYIRERDKGKGCISCGSLDDNLRYDAGHYRTVGAHPELRFDEDNCHRQCHYNCNIMRSGNIVDYRIGLVGRIGAKRLERLEGNHGAQNYTLTEIIEIKDLYRAKLKDMRDNCT